MPAKHCILCPHYTPCPIPLPLDGDGRETIRRLATVGVPMIPLKDTVTLPVHHVPPEMQHHTRKHDKPAPTARQRARPARRKTRRLTLRKRPAEKRRPPAPLPPEPKRKRLIRKLGNPPPPRTGSSPQCPQSDAADRRVQPQPYSPEYPPNHCSKRTPPCAPDPVPLPSHDLPHALTDTHSVCPSVSSSTSSLPQSTLVPIGVTASPEHTALVQHWWQQEIEPYKGLIYVCFVVA